MNRILFIWDQAGVSCVMAKWLRKKGHECKVIKRKMRKYDPFEVLDFYNEDKYDVSGEWFDEMAVVMAKDYDIIHVNSDFRLAARIKSQYPSLKTILEYHGSDARLTPILERVPFEKVVDKILVSTVDLYDYVHNSQWLPNPVDTEHFKPSEHKPGALFIQPHDQTVPIGIPFTFDVINRLERPIMYRDMPKLLENYHMYVDIRNDVDVGLVKSPSKTALEALATGMKVYNSDKLIFQGLPERNRPDVVTDKLLEIYNKL